MWADWWGFKLEAYDGISAEHRARARGRAPARSSTPTIANGIQRLNQEAAKAMRAGAEAGITISRADAVKWMTINPAKALGIEKVTGSLEPGKNADVVIWSGDPFSVYSRTPSGCSSTARWCTIAPIRRGQPRSDFMTGHPAAGRWRDDAPRVRALLALRHHVRRWPFDSRGALRQAARSPTVARAGRGPCRRPARSSRSRTRAFCRCRVRRSNAAPS